MKIFASKTCSSIINRCIVFILFVIVIAGCNCNRTKLPPPRDWHTYLEKSPYDLPPADPYKQLIVWLKPGTTDTAFNRWLRDNIVKDDTTADLKIRFVCGSCDSSLFYWKASR